MPAALYPKIVECERVELSQINAAVAPDLTAARKLSHGPLKLVAQLHSAAPSDRTGAVV